MRRGFVEARRAASIPPYQIARIAPVGGCVKNYVVRRRVIAIFFCFVVEPQMLAPRLWREDAMRVRDAVDLGFAQVVRDTERAASYCEKQSLAEEPDFTNTTATAWSKRQC
jgi:hypothetical protein